MVNEIKEHEDYNFVDGVAPEGIVNPSADALIQKAESKYGLVIFGARRARQINAYYANLQESAGDHVGPLVESEANDKALSVAMREIMADQIVADHVPDGHFNEDGYLVPEEFASLGAIEEEYIPAGTEEVIALEEVVIDDSAD